jgi:hypothetical protein
MEISEPRQDLLPSRWIPRTLQLPRLRVLGQLADGRRPLILQCNCHLATESADVLTPTRTVTGRVGPAHA